MKPSVYLAHPYARKEEIESRLQLAIEALDIEVVNPFQRGEQAIYNKAMDQGALTDQMCADIVRMDLKKIREADAVVACLFDVPSIGTYMEIFYASYVMEQQVFTYAPNKWHQSHPWIRNLSKVHPNQSELLSALKGWRANYGE